MKNSKLVIEHLKKKQYVIAFRKMFNKNTAISNDVVNKWKINLEGYKLCDIYNAEETALFYNYIIYIYICKLDKMQAFKNEK